MRRVHVERVEEGDLALSADEAHHVRDVLRLDEGAQVEVFDPSGNSGRGVITKADQRGVMVRVLEVRSAAPKAFEWVVAAAVPKGSRADWMIEKLSELGTAAFVPLATGRGVVLPEGQSKRQRWERIAAEAAKQSRRVGVMRIEPLTEVERYVDGIDGAGCYLSTAPTALPIAAAAMELAELAWSRSGAGAGMQPAVLQLLIGPEGGWTEREMERFEKAGLTGISLGATILRVETAAIAAAAIVAAVVAPLVEQKGQA